MTRPGPLAQRMLKILLAGVSTRRYAEVIPEMADTVCVAKSSVSREAIEASKEALRDLMERRLDARALLADLVARGLDPARRRLWVAETTSSATSRDTCPRPSRRR